MINFGYNYQFWNGSYIQILIDINKKNRERELWNSFSLKTFAVRISLGSKFQKVTWVGWM